MAYVASTSRSGFAANLGVQEILHASGAGDVVFGAPHSNPVVFIDAVSAATVTVSAVTTTGCTVSGICSLLVIG